jgi:hypothetical protein
MGNKTSGESNRYSFEAGVVECMADFHYISPPYL